MPQVEESIEQQRRVFGRWLRGYRVDMNLDQIQAAHLARISRVQYARIESGATGTTRETVESLARALRAPMSQALRLAGFASPDDSAPATKADIEEIRHAMEAIKRKLGIED